MSETLSGEKVDLLGLDIDTRLSDLMLGACELNNISEKTARNFIAASYYQGIDDVILGAAPETIFLGHGYPLPNENDFSNYPPWAKNPDHSPDKDDIIGYLEFKWKYKLSDITLDSTNLGHLMRHAYGSAYCYAYYVHIINS